MKRYSEYKDSGVKWIGEIPGHWKISHIKHHSQFINGYAFDSKIFNNNNKGVKVIRIGNIDGTLNYDTCIFASIESNLIRQFKTCKNDILIAMSGATIGKSCKVSEDDEAYINQRVGIIRCQCFSYMHYYIQAPLFRIFIDINNAGCAQPNISSSTIGNMLFPIPPLNEQEAIVTYLDTKVAKIDEYIAIAEKKIAALEELKQTIIAEAVTRGIHKEVPMKDSGVKWIGMIPEHWKVSKIRSLLKLSSEKTDEPNATLLSLSQYTGVKLKSECERTGMFEAENTIGYNVVHKGQFVMNIMLAWNGSYSVSKYDGVISPAYCVFDFIADCNKDYYDYLLRLKSYSGAFKTLSKGLIDSRLRLYPNYFKTFPILIPPLNEQQEIVTYIEAKVSNINQLCQAERSQIEKLKEYKQRLISDVVTGKVKVTND